MPVPLLSIAIFAVVWSFAAWLAASPTTLPTPWTVARLTLAELASGE